jgi:RHS repeat-associated protein
VEWNESTGEGATVIWGEGPYEFDGAGNIWRIGHRNYAYDGLDRLRRLGEWGNVLEAYEYDRWGNLTRLARTDPGAGSQFELELGGAEDTNRPSSVEVDGSWVDWLTWDARGNLRELPAFLDQRRKRFTFSGEDRLLVAEDLLSNTSWRFAYDTAGERVAAWRRDAQGELDELRLSLRDENGLVLADWLLVPGQSFGPAREYLYSGDRMVAQLDWVGGEVATRFATHDHLGSTRLLVSPDSTILDEIEFYPFGAFRFGGPVPSTGHLFTGHERDLGAHNTELDYMHARYFSPTIGRFLSIDPLGGEVGSSQSWNRYSYVTANPLRLVDRSGGYREDVHYDLTRVLALAAGYDLEQAKAIASANQAIDTGMTASTNVIGALFLDSGSEYHFTSPRRRAELEAKARSSRAAEDIGAYLHALQDSYSHSGYRAPLGHGLDSIVAWTLCPDSCLDPDDSSQDPSKAMGAALASYEALAAFFGGDPAVAFEEIADLVREYLRLPEDELEQRQDILDRIERLTTENREE